ncbi:hypothetical protein IKE13_03300 [Candidatus Saccharibacteria bacterium]|nr:hypothetical protein [Candidatus Saccharibacteria bacterium]
MEDFIFKHRKKIIALGVVALIAIVAVSVFFIVRDRLYSVTINITVAPTIAKVKIGDDEYGAVGEHKIRPGEYEIEVYAEGFISKTGKLTAVADETINFSTYLKPTEDNLDWYNNHPWDATVLGDIKNDDEIQKYYSLRQTEPILNYVPYSTYTYSINYEYDCAENGGGICLVLDGDMGLRNVMVRYLQRSNEDLSRYKVRMKNYEKPFSDAELSVPEGLDYDGNSEMDLSTEVAAVRELANSFAERQLSIGGYEINVAQIKAYGNYCGVKVDLSPVGGDGKVFDTYRMLIGKIDGSWMVISNLDWILSRFDNPKLPAELLRDVNTL